MFQAIFHGQNQTCVLVVLMFFGMLVAQTRTIWISTVFWLGDLFNHGFEIRSGKGLN